MDIKDCKEDSTEYGLRTTTEFIFIKQNIHKDSNKKDMPMYYELENK